MNLLFHQERCSISASEDILQDAAYLLCSWTHRIYANDGGCGTFTPMTNALGEYLF